MKNNTKLYYLRTAAGLTQEQVAADLGVALSTWQRWERDISEVKRSCLIQMAAYFNEPVKSFFPAELWEQSGQPITILATLDGTRATADHYISIINEMTDLLAKKNKPDNMKVPHLTG